MLRMPDATAPLSVAGVAIRQLIGTTHWHEHFRTRAHIAEALGECADARGFRAAGVVIALAVVAADGRKY